MQEFVTNNPVVLTTYCTRPLIGTQGEQNYFKLGNNLISQREPF